jgi:hypothetical protein
LYFVLCLFSEVNLAATSAASKRTKNKVQSTKTKVQGLASLLWRDIAKLAAHGGKTNWGWLSTQSRAVPIASRLEITTTPRASLLQIMTRRMIALAALKCFPMPAAIPPFPALCKTVSTYNQAGAILCAVEPYTTESAGRRSLKDRINISRIQFLNKGMRLLTKHRGGCLLSLRHDTKPLAEP